MFVVTVRLVLQENARDAYVSVMSKIARETLANEPQCLQFDVCSNSDDPTQVFLYEIYSNPDAFQRYVDSPYSRECETVVGPMVISRTVRTYDELSPAPG